MEAKSANALGDAGPVAKNAEEEELLEYDMVHWNSRVGVRVLRATLGEKDSEVSSLEVKKSMQDLADGEAVLSSPSSIYTGHVLANCLASEHVGMGVEVPIELSRAWVHTERC